MSKEAKIRAIAPWFGGKRTMAPLIVQELGKHTQYFEPFCGSMAVLFAKEPSRQETVNDLHADLTNLARVLAVESTAIDFYARTSKVIVSDGVLADAALELKEPPATDSPNVDRAFWYFTQSWCMRNGCAGTNIGQPRGVGTQLAVRFTANGGSPSVRFRNAVESIPYWHERLRNVVILNRDAFKILDRFDDVDGTAVYVDSPYVAASRSGFAGAGAQSRYLHEFDHGLDHRFVRGLLPDSCDACGKAEREHKSDHERLRDILATYKHARIVVSYYDCKEVRDLYSGWTFIDCTRQKNLHAANGRGDRKAESPEILIINGPSYAEAA